MQFYQIPTYDFSKFYKDSFTRFPQLFSALQSHYLELTAHFLTVTHTFPYNSSVFSLFHIIFLSLLVKFLRVPASNSPVFSFWF